MREEQDEGNRSIRGAGTGSPDSIHAYIKLGHIKC